MSKSNSTLTQQCLHERYFYQDGFFYRKIKLGTYKAGSKVFGTPIKDGYLSVSVLGRLYMYHRVIWLFHYGQFPVNQIDHINRIKNDNRIENLRDLHPFENAQNFYGVRKNNTSGARGVSLHKPTGLWYATIGLKGKRIKLGYFKDKAEAAKSYLDAAKKFHTYNPHAVCKHMIVSPSTASVDSEGK